MTTLLTKAAIMAADDLAHEDVAVPEWGGSVRVRELTAAESAKHTQSMLLQRNGAVVLGADGETPLMSASGLVDSDLLLLSMCLVDEAGDPLFGTKDLAKLGEKSQTALSRVLDVAKRLSGMEAPSPAPSPTSGRGGTVNASVALEKN